MPASNPSEEGFYRFDHWKRHPPGSAGWRVPMPVGLLPLAFMNKRRSVGPTGDTAGRSRLEPSTEYRSGGSGVPHPIDHGSEPSARGRRADRGHCANDDRSQRLRVARHRVGGRSKIHVDPFGSAGPRPHVTSSVTPLNGSRRQHDRLFPSWPGQMSPYFRFVRLSDTRSRRIRQQVAGLPAMVTRPSSSGGAPGVPGVRVPCRHASPDGFVHRDRRARRRG